MIKILHIISGLATGGAEMMLYKLLSGIDKNNYESAVISLADYGTMGVRIMALGIPVHAMNMRVGGKALGIYRLFRLTRDLQPDLIQGWLPHGNLAASLAGLSFSNRIQVIWNIRQSINTMADSNDNKKGTSLAIRMGARLSRWPRAIVYNNKRGLVEHESIGYQQNKSVLIPNGFNTDVFKPLVEARYMIREQLGVPPQGKLIGLVASYHPMKDHANFLNAAGLLLKKYHDVHFLLVGRGVDSNNVVLSEQINRLGIQANLHLLGERKDIAKLTAALDIATSSSRSEGFPNVIGEAMSCGIPCVVTDVGDSAWLVGTTGRVVPPQNAEALAAAWDSLLTIAEDELKKLGQAARKRIVSEFSIDKIIEDYERLYVEVLNGKKH